MIYKRPFALHTLAVLFAFACLGCKQEPATHQSSVSPPAATTPTATATTTSLSPTPASNANASSSDKGKIDACTLLTADEIKSVQGDTLKETTPSPSSDAAFLSSQCFYATSSFVNSVSITVTQQNANASGQSVKDFWKETFEKKVREKRQKKGEGPPQRVENIGDDAYSVGDAKVGALYVLKGDKFLRISVGGAASQTERIKRMKVLAGYAIKRV